MSKGEQQHQPHSQTPYYGSVPSKKLNTATTTALVDNYSDIITSSSTSSSSSTLALGNRRRPPSLNEETKKASDNSTDIMSKNDDTQRQNVVKNMLVNQISLIQEQLGQEKIRFEEELLQQEQIRSNQLDERGLLANGESVDTEQRMVQQEQQQQQQTLQNACHGYEQELETIRNQIKDLQKELLDMQTDWICAQTQLAQKKETLLDCQQERSTWQWEFQQDVKNLQRQLQLEIQSLIRQRRQHQAAIRDSYRPQLQTMEDELRHSIAQWQQAKLDQKQGIQKLHQLEYERTKLSVLVVLLGQLLFRRSLVILSTIAVWMIHQFQYWIWNNPRCRQLAVTARRQIRQQLPTVRRVLQKFLVSTWILVWTWSRAVVQWMVATTQQLLSQQDQPPIERGTSSSVKHQKGQQHRSGLLTTVAGVPKRLRRKWRPVQQRMSKQFKHHRPVLQRQVRSIRRQVAAMTTKRPFMKREEPLQEEGLQDQEQHIQAAPQQVPS